MEVEESLKATTYVEDISHQTKRAQFMQISSWRSVKWPNTYRTFVMHACHCTKLDRHGRGWIFKRRYSQTCVSLKLGMFASMMSFPHHNDCCQNVSFHVQRSKRDLARRSSCACSGFLLPGGCLHWPCVATWLYCELLWCSWYGRTICISWPSMYIRMLSFTMKLSATRHAALGRCGESRQSNTLTSALRA